jgi:hypothetical protein
MVPMQRALKKAGAFLVRQCIKPNRHGVDISASVDKPADQISSLSGWKLLPAKVSAC